MKRTNILAASLIAVSLISTGCGTSDYVQSIELTATTSSVGGGLYNLPGWGSTLQLQVNAVTTAARPSRYKCSYLRSYTAIYQ